METKDKAEVISAIINVNDIEQIIYWIRGQRVMLDADLAMIYGYEIKNLNRQVKRNINRFPEDFMFQLTKEELENLRCQIGTANISVMSRTMPYVFTEQGIYMLATVLRGEVAEQQSISIMRAFREMRHYIRQNHQFVTKEELRAISYRQDITDIRINEMKEQIDMINDNFISNIELKNFVIYKGQKFEADKAYIDIYQKAKKSIYVIDNYVNFKTLEQLSQKKKGVSVLLFTENKHGQNGFLTSTQVSDFNAEYPSLLVKPNPDCHDRFIVLDYKTATEKLYVCGASSKDAGNKVCSINEIENTSLIHPVIDSMLLNADKII